MPFVEFVWPSVGSLSLPPLRSTPHSSRSWRKLSPTQMESPPSNNDSSSTSTALSSSPPAPLFTQGKPGADTDSEANPMATSQADKTKRVNLSRTKSPKLDRPIAEIISENFPAFDADTLIVRPFEEEAARDAKFEEGMPACPVFFA
jgi:hypothetical protein